MSIVVDADVLERAPVSFATTCQGMMLEWCSISVRTMTSPGRSAQRAPAVGDEVDRFGRVAGEDDLARVRSVEETGDLAACLIVGDGGTLGQAVDAAMDVGVVLLVEVADGVDDAPVVSAMTLHCRDRRSAIVLDLRQDWEICTESYCDQVSLAMSLGQSSCRSST